MVTAFPTPERCTRSKCLNDLPDLLTVEEAAGYLRICRNTAYDAVRRGEIPCVRFGVRIRVPKHALDQMLQAASAA